MGFIIVLVVLVAVAASLFYRISREVVSELKVLNREADKGTALVVYHPGLTGFQKRVTYAFADGLVSSGWRVVIATASSQASTDLSSYNLLVLGSPTYFWAPARPIQSYLSKLGDLGRKRTAIIVTGLGATGRSMSIMQKLVEEVNGDLVKSLSLTALRPNKEADPRPNKEVALEMAAQAGKEIPLPGE